MYILRFLFGHCYPFFTSLYGSVFDFAHRLQQRGFAPLRRHVAVGLEQFPEMTDEVGIGKQARPVGALGEQFSVFAHTQNWPGRCFVTAGKYSVRILRLDFRAGLNKMTEVTLASATFATGNLGGRRFTKGIINLHRRLARSVQMT